jgi:rhomboid protease GluP
MKTNYMNALTYEFIQKENFLPVKDRQGNYALYERRHVLQLKQRDKLRIAEIIDGDSLSSEDIRIHCEANVRWLSKATVARISKVIDVFVFERYPDEQKEQIIRSFAGNSYGLIITAIDSKKVFSVNDIFNDEMYISLVKKAYDEDQDAHTDLGKSYEVIKAYNEEIANEIHPPKMWATYSLMGFTVLIFIMDYVLKYLTGEEVLKNFGVKQSVLITMGQYWRLFTPMFLHADLVHIGSNMLSLYILGQAVEKFYGPAKFTAIYLIGGIMGNIFSYTLTEGISLGASGAVFAVGGAIVLIWKMKASRLLRASGRDLFLVILIVINIVMGFSGGGVDNWAHLGGLAGGFLLSLGLGYKNNNIKREYKILAIAAYIVIAVIMFAAGYEKWRTIITVYG